MVKRAAGTVPQHRAVIALLAALVLVAGVAVGGVVWWRHAHRGGLERALRLVPGDVHRYSWTDWAGVRRAVGVEEDPPSAADLETLLAKGYDADLTAASAMVSSAEVLRSRLGFSPATARWELFAQSEAGAVVVVDLPSTDGVTRSLGRAGYVEGAGGIWDGSQAAADLSITPEFAYLAVREGRVLGSDSADYLRDVLDGTSSPAEPVAEVVGAVGGDALSAVAYSGDYACSHLAMSQADDADRTQAAELIRQAGGVDPLTAFAMAAYADRRVRVALAFDGHDRAVHDADARAALAGGAAPGQGGTFPERFRLGRVSAEGDVVTMRLHPRKGAAVLSDLTTGPVLFASC